MTADSLDRVWADLPSPAPGELSGIRAAGLPLQSAVYIVVDGGRTRQLMVALAEGVEPLRSSVTRGLEVTTDDLRIGDSPVRRYVRLVCLDPSHHATFAALCSNIVASVQRDPADPKAAVVRCLDRWRSFWVVDQSGLTREQALGLFGELWFLYRWSGPVSISSLARWQGPLGARHDFQWPVASVESKASASVAGAGPTHFIASLDQLSDPESGRLYLFSLHLAEDNLAANSLPVLVETISTALGSDVEALSLFLERLAKAGYNPAEAGRYTRPFRVVAEELYRVDGSFPRLTRDNFGAGLPAGIGDVSYTLSMDACAPWRIATFPGDPGAAFLRINAL
jgi:Putative  PD-(D/E)XK family member, (DUF4420)